MTMIKWEELDRALNLVKRVQRRFYFADYADEELKAGWAERPPSAPYEEHVFPVAPPQAKMKEILIFKPDEIGDSVCALPALGKLKSALPDARFSLICQKSVAPLMERTGLFSAIAPLEVKMRLLRFPTFSVKDSLKHFSAKRFDLAIFLRTYPSYFDAFRKLPADVLLHPRDPRMPSHSPYQPRVSLWGKVRKHQALQMMEIISPFLGTEMGRSADFGDLRFPALRWTDRDRQSLDLAFPGGAPARFGVIHPFNRYETRRYPIDYWRTLLEALSPRFEMPFVVVGGEGDGPFPKMDGVIALQGKLDLAQTAYLISRASAFLGTDSGPAHLAGMLGVPTVNLRGGQAGSTEWAPLGRTLILRADVPCAPCHRRVCPGYGLKCLTELTPDRVLPEIMRFLSRAEEHRSRKRSSKSERPQPIGPTV
jgi:ADP-heptose:LPS heptosyltransferase